MANFNSALEKVLRHEGLYSNNPNDAGGETFMGICRKFYPKLKLWVEIDKLKKTYGDKNAKPFINGLSNKGDIINEVRKVYKENYWDKCYLDNAKNQRISEIIFDDAVNRGVIAAIKTAQKILKIEITGKVTNEYITKIENYGRKTK